MKWILCGKNTACVACLEFLHRRGDEVWAVCTRDDTGQDGWQPSLRAAAQRRGIRWSQPQRINDPDVYQALANFEAQGLISIQYDQILKGRLFEAMGCPCLNLHFSLLPRHRGVAPVSWAIVSGDSQAGVTLHHMIEDIDAGDVVAQRAVPIPPDGTARELYDDLSAAAVGLFEDSYPFAPELLARRLAQDTRGASYHRQGDFDFSHRRIDWSRPGRELHTWVRAMIFPPMQQPETTLEQRTLAVTRVGAELGKTTSEAPGVVVGRSQDGIDVATGHGSLRVLGLSDTGAPETPSASLVGSVSLGDRFR